MTIVAKSQIAKINFAMMNSRCGRGANVSSMSMILFPFASSSIIEDDAVVNSERSNIYA